jgi:hypothetical protein
MARLYRLGLIAVAGTVMVGADVTLWMFGRTSVSSPEFPPVTRIGPAWTNEQTGETAFESTGGCGSEDHASSISFGHGWFVRAWVGPKNMVTGRYLASTALPDDAVFTGWARAGERLWFRAADKTRGGEYDFLYVERADRTERWPRATFGCL